jgi:hypothetical protein
MKSTVLVACAAIALSAAVPAFADDEAKLSLSPYFGANYDLTSLHFKNGYSSYADSISGASPFVGVNLGRYFALELSVGVATGERAVSDTLSYHSSMRGEAIKLMVHYPLGSTGFAPYLFTGLSVMKMKESSFSTSIDPKTQKPVTTYSSLSGKSEADPIFGGGISYVYSGLEIRAGASVQTINWSNSGQYAVTFGGGLAFHL